MKRWWIGCGLLLLVGVGTIWLWVGRRANPTTKELTTYKVRRGTLTLDVTESGAIEPVRVVEIKSKVSGRVAALLVEEGDRVRKGQLLARIDPRETQQQVEQGRAQTEIARASTRKAELALELQRQEALNQLKQAQIRVEGLRREYQIQPRLTRSALETARSNYENAQKSLDLLVNVTHPKQRVEVETALQEAQAEQEEAKRNYERMVNLLAKGYVSQQQVDAARTRWTAAEGRLRAAQERQRRLEEQQKLDQQSAEARLKAAEAELERAQANTIQDELKCKEYEAALESLKTAQKRLSEIEMRQWDLQQAKASERQAQSSLKNLLIQFSETDVRSPLAGVVTRRYREVGELVMSGIAGFGEGTPILQIADLAQMKIRLNLNELDISKVAPGMRVEVQVDAVPNKLYCGVVKRIAPAAQQPQAQNQPLPGFGGGVVKYPVEVYLLDADSRLKPGMTARCRIITAEYKNALLLPLEAVGEEKGNYYVLKIEPGKQDKEGKPIVTRTPVKVGPRSANEWLIREGVKEGDRVQKAPFTGPKRREFEMRMEGEARHGEEKEDRSKP